jgi:hypothetical protein
MPASSGRTSATGCQSSVAGRGAGNRFEVFVDAARDDLDSPFVDEHVDRVAQSLRLTVGEPALPDEADPPR